MLRAERAMHRRRRIVMIAAAVFAEHGYSTTSMTQIATAAGASKETLYAYFGDKAGLLREALVSLVNDPVRGVDARELTTSVGFEASLCDLAGKLVSDLMQPAYLGLARIVIAETPRDPDVAELFRESVAIRALSSIADVLRVGQRRSLVDPDVEVSAAARAFVGPLLTFILLDGLLHPPAEVCQPSREAIEHQVAIFVRSVQIRSVQPTATIGGTQ